MKTYGWISKSILGARARVAVFVACLLSTSAYAEAVLSLKVNGYLLRRPVLGFSGDTPITTAGFDLVGRGLPEDSEMMESAPIYGEFAPADSYPTLDIVPPSKCKIDGTPIDAQSFSVMHNSLAASSKALTVRGNASQTLNMRFRLLGKAEGSQGVVRCEKSGALNFTY